MCVRISFSTIPGLRYPSIFSGFLVPDTNMPLLLDALELFTHLKRSNYDCSTCVSSCKTGTEQGGIDDMRNERSASDVYAYMFC